MNGTNSLNVKHPVLIASHDAGGADVLLHWSLADPYLHDATFCVSGPAKSRFSSWLTNNNCVSEGNLNLDQFNTLITSTSGYGVSLEKDLILLARKKSIRSITLLDHWTNYKDRFEHNGKCLWPDDIVVFDRYAENLINELIFSQQQPHSTNFINPRIHLSKNYFLDEKAGEIARIERLLPKKRLDEVNILYVTEPSTDARYHELDVLDRFLSQVETNLSFIVPYSHANNLFVRIRPHPKEPRSKYLKFTEGFEDSLELSNESSLAEDIAWANLVVGCQTMAMVVALHAGKKVLSSLPSDIERCALPHSEIIRIYPHASNSRAKRT